MATKAAPAGNAVFASYAPSQLPKTPAQDRMPCFDPVSGAVVGWMTLCDWLDSGQAEYASASAIKAAKADKAARAMARRSAKGAG